MVAVVGHRHGLGEPLGLVVHAARPDGVDVAPIVFLLRMHEGVAVALAGGGEQERRALVLGEAQGVMRAQGADFQGRDG